MRLKDFSFFFSLSLEISNLMIVCGFFFDGLLKLSVKLMRERAVMIRAEKCM